MGLRMNLIAIGLMSVSLGAYAAETDQAAPGHRVDCSTLRGKVMAGYQGWFTAGGDGAKLGWRHYSKAGEFRPGVCSIDLWPDMSELDADEKFATPFRHADGRTAYVFSSHAAKTVARHFRWMQEYGIDGVFLQRFAVETRHEESRKHCDTVLANCRAGASRYGRCYALMYDLSGLPAGGTRQVIADWKRLVDQFKIARGDDDCYLRHQNRPVVAVWGIGFNDRRAYSLAECDALIEFLKSDPYYGGNLVLAGVPTGWRTLDRDAVRTKDLHDVLAKADILSPWTIGRFHSLTTVDRHAKNDWESDIAWCQEHGKEYLPVVFPGFSWHNLRGDAPLDQIPRLKGEFLWRQYVRARQSGATMIYQAMFDEMDEGTAIFKCTSDPPIGASRFVTYEELPSDHYLWVTGQGGKLIRGEIPLTESMPQRVQSER